MIENSQFYARQRTPSTGRSNYSSRLNTDRKEYNDQHNLDSSRNSNISFSSSVKADLNDPINIFRPFTPERKVMNAHIVNPPILPKSRFPTVPLPITARKPSRPITCPEEWIKTNQKPDLFEKSSFHNNLSLDSSIKKEYSQQFCERNQDQLWKFDTNYLYKTPRTVCYSLQTDPDFVTKATKFHMVEKKMKVSGSHEAAACLIDRRIPNKIFDPFATSITTSREEREQRVLDSLVPSITNVVKDNRRGYKHAPEFGNFSGFNAMLKQNAGATLKR
eukprot:gene7899-10722_t